MGVAGVILAAGASRRMGGRNKLLLAGRDGVAMVARVAQACLASRLDEVLAVLGHQEDAIRAVLPGVRWVAAAHHGQGMAESLKAGIAALGPGVSASLICLGDMPLVSAEVIDRLLGAFVPGGIVVPVHGGRRGNPVLWDRRYFGEMLGLSGDLGARALLGGHAARVVEVDVATDAVLVDFDTPDCRDERF